MEHKKTSELGIGLVLVITGNGKGKTTSALGQAIRALGHGYRVFFLQFMKGKSSGELVTIENNLPGIEIKQVGSDSWAIKKEIPDEVHIKYAEEGLEIARATINSGEYEIVILDEINVALDFNLLRIDKVVNMIINRPRHVSVILTGRNAPNKIIEIANTVSCIKEVKHHYNQGTPAQIGIEF